MIENTFITQCVYSCHWGVDGFLSLLVSFMYVDSVTVLLEVVPRASVIQRRIKVSAFKLPV